MMSECVNENCDKDPYMGAGVIIVTQDGDAACCAACKVAYEKQRDHFFNVTLRSSESLKKWLLGEYGDNG
jgi:hypothetical protein